MKITLALVLSLLAVGMLLLVADDEHPPPAARSAAPIRPAEMVRLTPDALPTPDARYTLLVGQFADEAGAQTLATRIVALGLTTAVTSMVDGEGRRWVMLTVGDFGSVDEALHVGAGLTDRLALDDAPRVALKPGPPVGR